MALLLLLCSDVCNDWSNLPSRRPVLLPKNHPSIDQPTHQRLVSTGILSDSCRKLQNPKQQHMCQAASPWTFQVPLSLTLCVNNNNEAPVFSTLPAPTQQPCRLDDESHVLCWQHLEMQVPKQQQQCFWSCWTFLCQSSRALKRKTVSVGTRQRFVDKKLFTHQRGIGDQVLKLHRHGKDDDLRPHASSFTERGTRRRP